MKPLVGPRCPDCEYLEMYRDVSRTYTTPPKWVWYCPECGKELPIKRRSNMVISRSAVDQTPAKP